MALRPTRPLQILLALTVLSACSKQRPDQRWVHEIKLSGNKTIEEDDILDGLWTQETSWWSWTPFADKHWYEPPLLDQDMRRIEAYYARRGFFRAKVLDRRVQQREGGGSVDIAISVEEGQPTEVTSISVAGLEGLPEPLRSAAAAGLELKRGARFDHGAYTAAKAKIQARLKEAGHAYAKVEGQVRVDRDRHSAELQITAKPGPKVRFGPTKIKADPQFPADKLRRLVAWEEGQTYDPAEVERTKKAFHRHRVFSTVRVDLPEAPVALAPVTIETTPAKLRELRLGLGLGIEKKRHEVRLRGTWTIRNFLGGLRKLRVRLQPAFVAMPAAWDAERLGPAIESDVKLTQPDWLGTGIDAHLLVGYDLGIHEGYQYHGPRLGVGIERELGLEWLRAGLSWNLRFLDFFNLDEEAFDPSTTPLGLGFVDPFRLAYLEQFVRVDLRDDKRDPRAGLWAEARVEEGFSQIASEFTYVKVAPEARGYIPLGTKRLVLALRAQFAQLKVLGEGQSSPVTQRVAYGGPTSHRGFTYGRLSPQGGADRVPLGGTAGLLFSSDLRLRIYKVADAYWLGLTGFFDAGDVVAELDELALSRLHLTAGFSINFQTPVGAIRTGLGFRINRTEDDGATPDPDEFIAFHLTIGEAF